ncbi:hypothetical protein BDV23DRAFT_172166 [Aspergillus alliaceus]|uniref:Uncharacterized protein n=1 Tax=Petromyces alliaceus TaxID=209559 RepID=A0A5N7CA63_PETAA|nr:hypothetical protein BDV23DRAFT_172166 [Aspergillus alliaceus]
MKDISMEAAGIMLTAISDPFPLFTEEAIRQVRAEVFSRKMLEKHQKHSFVYDAWGSPVALGVLSKVAGIHLVPAMDVDVGHVNILKLAFDWYSDNYTFVCVTMLLGCAGMVGSESAIRTGTGEVLKFRGPATGRYIEHQALKAFGGRERTSMGTVLRPKSPFVYDDETTIKPLLPTTHKNTLYYQYAEYRLENLEERVRHQLKVIRQQKKKTHRDFDIAATREFLLERKSVY